MGILGTLTKCACLVAVLAAVLALTPLVLFALAPPQLPHAEFFANDQVENVLPRAPASYPEAFQGVIWMDQAGSLALTDIPFGGAPDLALSFGDTEYTQWDPKTRTLEVDTTGPAWTWFNRWDGYASWWFLKQIRYYYLFYLSPDEQVVQVYPSVNLPIVGKLSMPKEIVSFQMVKMTPPAGASCPPAPSASREEFTKCATWDRKTTFWATPLLGRFGVFHYYVFQIVDGKGRRLQPYYDRYVAHANRSCRPNRLFAKILGLSAAKGGDCPTAFRGVRQGARKGPAPKSTEL